MGVEAIPPQDVVVPRFVYLKFMGLSKLKSYVEMCAWVVE